MKVVLADNEMRMIFAAGGVNIFGALAQFTIVLQCAIALGTLYLIGRKIWKEHRRK